MSHIRVRFAPSPTGTLHVGGARTALFNWLYARKRGGEFILRIEDTDQERSTTASHDQILRSMEWLGLDWDGDPIVQSARKGIYDEYAQRALDEGLAYRCYCTPDELEAMRETAMAEGRQNVYDGRCRDLSEAGRTEREADGRTHVVRVRMPDDGFIRWTDLVHGDMEFECAVLDDWVAVKSDGFPTYNFSVVVDDGLMEISHVLRGDDHISNTPRQIHLFKGLGFRVPKFGHMPMILGPDKQRLSKRHGAASVEEFRDAGYLPDGLMNYLALLGWSPGNNQEVFGRDELIKAFSLKRLNNTAAVFDPEKCRHINAEHMKLLSPTILADMSWPYLVAAGLVRAEDTAARMRLNRVVEIMGARLSFFGDVADRVGYFFSDEYPIDPEATPPDAEALQRLKTLADRYEGLDSFATADADTGLRGLANELEIKVGELVHPARFAISGQKVGPSLFEAMEVLGQETTVRRLREPRGA